MNILCVGTSPHARRSVEIARRSFSVHRTITCNGGIRIIDDPDVYMLVDRVACDAYETEALAAKERGTDVVCPALPTPQAILDAERTGQRVVLSHRYYVPGARFVSLEGYEPIRLSGLWCAEHAAREGASQIFLAGYDGYATDGSPWYAEGIFGHEMTRGRPPPGAVVLQDLNAFSARRFSTLFRKYRATMFTFIGRPLYADRLDREPNWRTHDDIRAEPVRTTTGYPDGETRRAGS